MSAVSAQRVVVHGVRARCRSLSPWEYNKDRAIRECAKLLALRIDRGAPAEMIDCQAHRLADLINPPAPPAFSYQDTPSSPSVAAQVLTGAAVGLAVAAVGRSGIGRT